MSDPYITHLTCWQCKEKFEIRVPSPINALYVIDIVMTDLGGKCKKCLEKQTKKEK